MDTKSHPPKKKKTQTKKKKKSKLSIYVYIYVYLSIEGTLQEHCAVLISKSLPACVSYTFCIAVLFVLGEKLDYTLSNYNNKNKIVTSLFNVTELLEKQWGLDYFIFNPVKSNRKKKRSTKDQRCSASLSLD